jgi:hypothetical protein
MTSIICQKLDLFLFLADNKRFQGIKSSFFLKNTEGVLDTKNAERSQTRGIF